jgi:hypothetical protein
MVWIHGGANIRGSGGDSLYGPQFFADYGDIVLVTINYRLGAFGFLSLETSAAAGNMGHKGGLYILANLTPPPPPSPEGYKSRHRSVAALYFKRSIK